VIKRVIAFSLLVMMITGGVACSQAKNTANKEEGSVGNIKLRMFGTAPGSEPMEERYYTSFALEYNGALYWFDAGEGCSHIAHTTGADLQTIQAIFISHSHFDHIAGLAGLYSTMAKLDSLHSGYQNKQVELYVPSNNIWPGVVMQIGQLSVYQNFKEHIIKDGVLYQNEDITVEALHNNHLGTPKDGVYQSFSFKIRLSGINIVYSGDIGSVDDLAPIMDDCDVLLIETGHQEAAVHLNGLEKMEFTPKTVMFLHHSRNMMRNGDSMLDKQRKTYPGTLIFLNDGDIYSLPDIQKVN